MLRLLPGIVYQADVMTRSDMWESTIPNETTYVGAMLARSRDLWRLAGGFGEFWSATVPQGIEQKFGIDAIIIVDTPNAFKVIAIEAKRPNYKQTHGVWDKPHSALAGSRFAKQIALHLKLHSSVISGGFFIDGRAPYSSPSGFDDLGGMFVLTKELSNHYFASIKSRSPFGYWINQDVQALAAAGKGSNLYSLMTEVVNCRIGKPMSGMNAYDRLISELRHIGSGDDGLREHSQRPDRDEVRLIGRLARAFGASVAVSFSGPWLLNDAVRTAHDRERVIHEPTFFSSGRSRVRS